MTANPFVLITIAIISACLGAWLNHVFSIKRKRKDELAEFRLKAYVDFINAVSRLVNARRIGLIFDELDELTALNDAKIRICICAEAPVVESLVEFWKCGGTLEGELEILAFTHFCMQIRENLGNSNREIYALDISNTLFKLQPATYSFKHAHQDRKEDD